MKPTEPFAQRHQAAQRRHVLRPERPVLSAQPAGLGPRMENDPALKGPFIHARVRKSVRAVENAVSLAAGFIPRASWCACAMDFAHAVISLSNTLARGVNSAANRFTSPARSFVCRRNRSPTRSIHTVDCHPASTLLIHRCRRRSPSPDGTEQMQHDAGKR